MRVPFVSSVLPLLLVLCPGPVRGAQDGVISFINSKDAPVQGYRNIEPALYLRLDDPDQKQFDSLYVTVIGRIQKEAEKVYLAQREKGSGVFFGKVPFDFKSGAADADGDIDILLDDAHPTDTLYVTYIDLASSQGTTFPVADFTVVTRFDAAPVVKDEGFAKIDHGPEKSESAAAAVDTADTTKDAPAEKKSAPQTVWKKTGGGTKVSGKVSGTWSAARSPYYVIKEVTVQRGSTLVIRPGTRVLFNGYFRIKVEGRLTALGTEDSTILFGSNAGTPARGNWDGIYLDDSASVGSFDYCAIRHSYHGIYVYDADSVTVRHGTFSTNSYAAMVLNSQKRHLLVEGNDITGSDYGVVCSDGTNGTVNRNTIDNIFNHGIYCEKSSSPLISNNTVCGARSGGVVCMNGSSPEISWNIVCRNNAGISCVNSSPTVKNNKIVDNKLSGVVCFGTSKPVINRNSITDNGLFNLKNESANPIDAKGNWWGQKTTAQMMEAAGKPDANITSISDKLDNPKSGPVDYSGFATSPLGGVGEKSLAITEFELKADEDFKTACPDSAFLGDRVFIRAKATDMDPRSIDELGVKVFAEKTDPKGFMLLLKETDKNTGEYRGTFLILDKTNALINQIGAAYGDRVRVIAADDSIRQATFSVYNRRPQVARFRLVGVKDSLHLTGHRPQFAWHYTDQVDIDLARLVHYIEDEQLKKKMLVDLKGAVVADPQQEIEVEVATDASFGSMHWKSGPLKLTDTLYTYAGDSLQNGVTYHVRLRASDGRAKSVWQTLVLRMNSPPGAPDPQEPCNQAVAPTLFPSLKVGNAVDKEGDPLIYTFLVAKDAAFADTVLFMDKVKAGQAQTSKVVTSALEENLRYYWKARATDGSEAGPWSAVADFYANAVEEVIKPFRLREPENEQIIETVKPLFKWEKTEDPDPLQNLVYAVHLSRNKDFSGEVTVLDSLKENRAQLQENLKDNVFYYWRVVAKIGPDEQWADQQDWRFFTNALNDPPVLSPIKPITFREDTKHSFLVLDKYVSDPDNSKSELIWSVTGNDKIGVAIDSTTRKVTFSAPANWHGGPENITFTVRDFGSDPVSVTVPVTVSSVNDLPQVKDIPDVVIDEDHTAVIELDSFVTDIDHRPGQMTWTYRDAWKFSVAIDSSTHRARITPPENWYGKLKKLSFIVTDPEGGQAQDVLSVTVNTVNDTPVINPQAPIVFDEEATYVIDLDTMVHDVDHKDAKLAWRFWGNDTIRVKLDEKRHRLSFSAPRDWFGGPETIGVEVCDPFKACRRQDLSVTVKSVNDPPVVEEIPAVTYDEDHTASLALDPFVSDVDHAITDLHWEAKGQDNVIIAIDSTTRTASFSVKRDWNGTEKVTFLVTDPLKGTAWRTVPVIIRPINDPPVVTMQDAASFKEDESITLALDDFVADVDNTKSQLTWAASEYVNIKPVIDKATRKVTFSAPRDWFGGPERIKFEVTDPGGLKASGYISVTVEAVNDAPVVAALPASSFKEDKTLEIGLDQYVTDVDNPREKLAWTCSGMQNIKAVVDNTRRVITFSAPADWNGGPETISLTVSDPDGLKGQGTVAVTVEPVNDGPVLRALTAVTFAEDGQAGLALDDFVTDIDNTKKELTWSFSGNQKIIVKVTAAHQAVFTAPENWNGGPERITFTVKDPGGLSAVSTVPVTVTAVNDPPVVAALPASSFKEDEKLTVALDDYVADVDNGKAQLKWSAAGNIQVKTAIDPATRMVTFTAPANWNGGPEKITFTVTDPAGLTGKGTMAVTVTPVNDGPVLKTLGTVSFKEDGRATLALDGFVTDIDDKKATLDWTFTGNDKISVSIDAGHNAVFTAPADWNGGPEKITFTVKDPGGLSAANVLPVTVEAVNDAPVVAALPASSFNEDEKLVLALDDYVTDVDHGKAQLKWSTAGNVQIKAVVNAQTRTVTFTAPADWNGGAEKITLTATDPTGAAGKGVIAVTVTPVNDGPVVKGPARLTFAEDGDTTLVLDNTVTDVDNGKTELTWTVTGGKNITATIGSGRKAVFKAAENFNGGPEPLTFTVKDPGGLSAFFTVQVTVKAVNDAPVVTALPASSFKEDEKLTVTLDDYVTDVDNGKAQLAWSVAGNQQLKVSIDKTTRTAGISAPKDWNGGPEKLTFTATDPAGLTGTGAMAVTVTPVNDAPVLAAIPQVALTEDRDTALALDGFVTDIDDKKTELAWEVTGGTNITVKIAAGRKVVFTPKADWTGGPEKVTLTVKDPGGLSADRTVSALVRAVNDPPVIKDITETAFDEDEKYTLALDGIVDDVDNTKTQLVWSVTAAGSLKAVITAATRTLTLTAPKNWHGGPLPVTLTVKDPSGASDTKKTSFTVKPVNDAPVIKQIPAVSFDEDTKYTLKAMQYLHDADNSGDQLSLKAENSANIKAEVDQAAKTVTFRAAENFAGGPEKVNLTVTDNGGLSASRTVDVSVKPVNDPPRLAMQDIRMQEDGRQVVELNPLVSDPDDKPAALVWTAVPDAPLKAAYNKIKQTVTLTPPKDWAGVGACAFTVKDAAGATDEMKVKVTVEAVNDPPVLKKVGTVSFKEDETYRLSLSGFASDVDDSGSALQFDIAGGTNVTAKVYNATSEAVFTPAENYTGGPETFTLSVTDEAGAKAETGISVTVTPVNDAPVFKDIPPMTCPVEDNLEFDLKQYVTDVDDDAARLKWSEVKPLHSKVSLKKDGRVKISPKDKKWTGEDKVVFTVTDVAGASAKVTVTVRYTDTAAAPAPGQ